MNLAHSISGPERCNQSLHQSATRNAVHDLFHRHDRADVNRVRRGIMDKARQRREARPGMSGWKPDKPAWTADPHCAPKGTLHVIRNALQLRAAACQNNLPANWS
jgi:hypothetical protein